MSLSTLFKSNVTISAHTSRDFLKLTRKCMERVQKMTSKGIMFTPPKFNYEQCKYLADKLKLVVESAETLPPQEVTNCFEIFKLVHGFAIVVETFIQKCRQDRWIQAAMTMTNLPEHVSSLGFYLEAISRSFLGVFTLTSFSGIYQSEVETIEEKASYDRETLLRNLSALLQTKPTTWKVYQLATLLLKRLQHPQHHKDGSMLRLFHNDKDNLKEKEKLGRGSFATVFKASWLGIEVAKKTFYARDSPDFENEVSILQTLSHPNIASLFGYAKDDQECSMIMELMDEDLFSLIQRRMKENKKRGYPFDILEAMDLMLQIGGGMKYLHEMRIVHRDLKSMNILLKHVKTRDSKIVYVLAKVSDFGLSKIKQNSLTQSSQTPNMGTARWMAPEMIKLHLVGSSIEIANADATSAEVAKHPFKSDVYSFAMVCYEILSGKVPYFEERTDQLKKKVLGGDRPQLPSHCPPAMKSLMEKCWNADASKRPSFTEIFAELQELQCLLLMSRMTFHKKKIEVGTSSGEFKWGIHGRKFTIGEVRKITNDFSVSLKIGNRLFGTFYRGVLPDGTLLAVWRSNLDSYWENFKNIQAEIQSSDTGKAHPNFLQLVGDCVTPNRCFLIYPHISKGTVHSQLQKVDYRGRALSFKIRKHIAIGVAKGLAYLHEECNPKIVHHNVRSDTILLDDKYEALVSSFEFCEVIDPMPSNLLQSTQDSIGLGYMPPEYLSKRVISEKTNVYSYGIVLLELITGRDARWDVPGRFRDIYIYLSDWVKKEVSFINFNNHESDLKFINFNIHELDLKRIVDSKLLEYNYTEMKDLLQVALSCTQLFPSARPKMSEVVSMLQREQP